jgi:hypothetical protein
MYKKYISYICIFIILLCIEIRVLYKYIVKKYLNWNYVTTSWKKYINLHNVGLWFTTNTIEKANKNLYSFMYSKANINDTHTVLNLPKKEKKKEKKKNKYKKKWDRIIAIEQNLNNLHELLNEDGILVCSNIVLKDNTPSSFYLDIICDFLCIPKVSYSEWKSTLENNFILVELYDTTEYSMNPYYNYLFNSFVTKKQLPQCIADILIYYFKDVPCQYMIAVCKIKKYYNI